MPVNIYRTKQECQGKTYAYLERPRVLPYTSLDKQQLLISQDPVK